MIIKLPDSLIPILNILIKNKVKCIIVGGFVRDALLNVNSKDIDIEIYNIDTLNKIQKILKPFGKLNLIGKKFGILKLRLQDYEIDFSLPRIDIKISSGHKGFKVLTMGDLEFYEASKRRDFTINSMGYDIEKRIILDPYNGLYDLKNKTLAYVNEQTFIQDPLRVFRAINFCARFNLTCRDTLIKKCCYIADNNLIYELPKERIFQEISKLLLLSKNPSIGFNLFKTFHLLRYFPELKYNQNRFYFIDNMANLKTDNKNLNIILILSVLVFDFPTKKEVEFFLKRFISSKYIINEILKYFIQKDILQSFISKKDINFDIYLLSTKINIKNLLLINEARGLKYNNIKKITLKLGVLTCKPKPLLKGKDLINLGLKPSIKFSEILNQAYNCQLKEVFLTKKEADNWLKKNIKTLV